MAGAATELSKPKQGHEPDFGSVANCYALLEKTAFGGALQRARLAHIDLITRSKPERILLTGDGDGRFLEVLADRLPNASITSLDSSRQMLARSAKRLGVGPNTKGRIRFVHGDLLQPAPEAPTQYDFVVSHFVLDCFRRSPSRGIPFVPLGLETANLLTLPSTSNPTLSRAATNSW